MKKDGYAILFITHKMREVMAVADRATVLRHGKFVGTLMRDELHPDVLVSMMLDIAVPEPANNNFKGLSVGSEPVLEFKNVSVGSGLDGRGLKNINLTVAAGEILGVAGVSGNGQQELGEVLFGMTKKSGGSITLHGDQVENWSTSRLVNEGVRYITEDPLAMAVVPHMMVDENLVLGRLNSYDGGKTWLSWFKIRRHLTNTLKSFPMALAGYQAKVSDLSGGNVQRVVLARELLGNVSTLIAYYPTRGLDVLTAQETRGLILEARNNGAAVMLVSEDLEELTALSDRMLVMYQGTIVGNLEPGEMDIFEIGKMMTGH